MTRERIYAIAVCVLANLIDGFDVLAIAWTAPYIANEWAVGPELLGAVFSAGLAGIALGSLVISPLADRLGRKPLALACLGVMAGSMALCGLAGAAWQLMVLRFLTGLGVGGILATLNSVVAECAPARHRNLAISIFAAAYPLGAIVGGSLALLLIEELGWRAVFVVGGVLSAITFLLHMRWLPPGAPGRGTKAVGGALGNLSRPPHRAFLALLSLGFFMHMFCVFFVLNWTPRLIEQMGFDAALGVIAAVTINVGSLVGGLSYGPLADRVGWQRSAPMYLLGFAATLLVFGQMPGSDSTLKFTAGLMGFFMGGVMTSLFAIAPVVFTTAIRVGATGVAIGIGRLGGMLSPVLAGMALSMGMTPGDLYLACAALPLLATFALGAMARRCREAA